MVFQVCFHFTDAFTSDPGVSSIGTYLHLFDKSSGGKNGWVVTYEKTE